MFTGQADRRQRGSTKKGRDGTSDAVFKKASVGWPGEDSNSAPTFRTLHPTQACTTATTEIEVGFIILETYVETT